MPFESPSTKRFVWLQAHSGPEVNQSQAICASNINHPAAAIDLFGAQFRSNGLQYCLSEVRQFLPAHSCCKFLEAVQDIEVNLAKRSQRFWSLSNFIKARCGRRTIFKRAQRKYSNGSVTRARIFKADKNCSGRAREPRGSTLAGRFQ